MTTKILVLEVCCFYISKRLYNWSNSKFGEGSIKLLILFNLNNENKLKIEQILCGFYRQHHSYFNLSILILINQIFHQGSAYWNKGNVLPVLPPLNDKVMSFWLVNNWMNDDCSIELIRNLVRVISNCLFWSG